MTNSILKITDKEYLIKLNRNTFNLSFIRNLLKIVEVAGPNDDNAFEKADQPDFNKQTQNEPEYYSYLEDK